MFRLWKPKPVHNQYEILGSNKDEVLRKLEEIAKLPLRDLSCSEDPLKLVSLIGHPVEQFSVYSESEKKIVGTIKMVGKSALGAESLLRKPLLVAHAAVLSGVFGMIRLDKNCTGSPAGNVKCQECGRFVKTLKKRLPSFGEI